MSSSFVKRALISVYDKDGVVAFARALVREFGVEILSTGGTASLLQDNAIPVTLVESVTDFPEMMDGRVKTLHPRIHAAILADRDNPAHMRQLEAQHIQPIDLVVVNLYPFEKTTAAADCTFEQAIEMIDIGGPCLLRAAAKNHKHVLVVDDPAGYEAVLEYLRSGAPIGGSLHREGAARAFQRTAVYDARVATWLSSLERCDQHTPFLVVPLSSGITLRYGENPHQTARLLDDVGDQAQAGLVSAELAPAGRQMSFNNYVDANAALDLCTELASNDTDLRACVFIKHTNACGVGVDRDPTQAYRKAYLGDPRAAMGGILAVSFEVDGAFAETVMDALQAWGKASGAGAFFVEVCVAPAFTKDAIDVVRSRKKWGANVRLLAVGPMTQDVAATGLDIKKIARGMLIQSRDTLGLREDQWKVVTRRAPSETELRDLRLAWLVCKHTKSNAISICKDRMLLGNGAGQMSRVMSCRIATWLAEENGHGQALVGAAAASDAFFPFADGPEILMDAGVTALIQPGGSKRDDETVRACNDRNVAMVFTGTRHFKH